MNDGRAGTHEGQAGAGDVEADAALATLEARAREARAAGDDRPDVEASLLSGLEHDLLAFTNVVARSEPTLADDQGHPVLADAARWRNRLRTLQLDEAAEKAGALLDDLVNDEAVRWCATAADVAAHGTADACYAVLAEASVLDREALARLADPQGAAPLAERRDALREALVARVESDPPDDAVRERWTTDLLDRADVVLTGIDDLEPAAASAQLHVITADIQWHARHVEAQRGPRRRRLRRKLSRLAAERQERDLQGRLETMFGSRNVGRFERLIIWLIFLVLGLLAVETFADLSPTVLGVFIVVDTLACLVFLWDFFFRLAIVKGKWRWFRRHALIDLLPSIPVGLLAWHPIRAGRALRFLRLARVAKYVRVLMPVIRIVRAVGFLTRGVDRVVRRYGHLLNRDVILYPTKEEKARACVTGKESVVRLRRLHAETNDLWEELLLSTYGTERCDVANARLEGFASARRDGLTERPPMTRERAAAAREVTAESLLRRLDDATAEGLEADLGPDFVSRVARAVRVLGRPPLRWIPFLGGWFPRVGPSMGDAEVAAAAAHRASARLRVHHDRWFWFADLYGTVTPAEFVDGVGSTMVKGAFRPAYKLVLFGSAFLFLKLLVDLIPWNAFHWAARTLQPLVEALYVLGGICVLVVAVGWWLRRVARRATAFYEQVVLAQFLALTESIKGRFLDRDARVLTYRAVGPESLLRGEVPEQGATARRERFVRGVRAWLLEAHAGGDARGAFDAMERTVLLHRDGLDGGLLHSSDTRTTNQLLGNPALRHLRRTAWCVAPAERKALHALDLEHQRRFLGGPYFWFGLVTRAVAQSTARLIVEYNRHAIPLAELSFADPHEREEYETWLSEDSEPSEDDGRRAKADDWHYVTAAFCALHFLDDDERRDAEVAERFGAAVRDRLVRDRRRLFRRIFGTYPLHTGAHEERVVNLYRIYEAWFAGGKALLLPLRGLWAAVKWVARVVGWIVEAVRQIRRPPREEVYESDAESDFMTAVRKIDRMRGPVVRAALWMRARMDPEYLGVRLPGTRRTGFERATVDRDLDFLDARGDLRRAVEQEHDGAQADMRRLARLDDAGLLERTSNGAANQREALRAAAFAYRADLGGVRSYLSASDVLAETAADVVHRSALPYRLNLNPRLRWTFRTWWKANGRGDRQARKSLWRAVLHDANGSGRALRVLASRDEASAVAEGEERLRALLRHPGRLSGQLVTLRAVQTLALIDVLNYRQHVWRLGDYIADGEDPGELLELA